MDVDELPVNPPEASAAMEGVIQNGHKEDEGEGGVELGFVSLFTEEKGSLKGLIDQSKVGGVPLWTHYSAPALGFPPHLETIRAAAAAGGNPAAAAAPASLSPELTCLVCQKTMVLLLQIYTPSPHHVTTYYHRVVYIFCCKNGACHKQPLKAFRVLRSQLTKENPYYLPNAARKIVETDKDFKSCVVCGMPGGKSCGKCHQVHYCSRDHQLVHWGLGHKEMCGKATPNPTLVSQFEKLITQFKFPEHEIETEEEVIDEEDQEDDQDDDDDDDDEEVIDTSENQMQVVKHASAQKSELEEAVQTLDYKNIKRDKVFLAFQQRISYYKDQILRYSRLNADKEYEPLWVSQDEKLSKDEVPHCETCGSRRTFEFQVMPQLLNFLRLDDTQTDSIDWGTLVVYTCPKFCQKEGQNYYNEFLWKQNFSNIGMPVPQENP